MKKSCIILLLLTASVRLAQAQQIRGMVYDITRRIPMAGVTVQSSKGAITQTDSTGAYAIEVGIQDSIWFSWLGKPTPRYPVKDIPNPETFDISIQLPSIELPNITIRKNSYRLDSLLNRQEYAKSFNYRKPGLRLNGANPSSMGAGVGLDMNELINVFRFRRKRNLAFAQRLLEYQEKEGYIDYRFNKKFISSLTKLEPPLIDSFMKEYRPTYEYLQLVNDAELGMYILECFKYFKQETGFVPRNENTIFTK